MERDHLPCPLLPPYPANTAFSTLTFPPSFINHHHLSSHWVSYKRLLMEFFHEMYRARVQVYMQQPSIKPTYPKSLRDFTRVHGVARKDSKESLSKPNFHIRLFRQSKFLMTRENEAWDAGMMKVIKPLRKKCPIKYSNMTSLNIFSLWWDSSVFLIEHYYDSNL